jgi:hypothetical protein
MAASGTLIYSVPTKTRLPIQKTSLIDEMALIKFASESSTRACQVTVPNLGSVENQLLFWLDALNN